ncbi:MAG: hypothetical protein ACI9WC_001644 [Arenicella sp.]|jgi:hypothetical protein
MQIVYLSNRPTLLLETLKQVVLFMPFVNEVVVCVPDIMVTEFNSCANQNCVMTVIRESEILNQTELASVRELDHQRRNYLLRTKLAQHEEIAEEFVMSDDDSRPLKAISLDNFVKDSKHRSFFYYDMREWNHNQTDFDVGQISTCAILGYHNLPQLSFASHMPQIINKSLFLEAAAFFEPHSSDQPICEWSSYFNFAHNRKPQLFSMPEPYQTLCWPEHPLAWKQTVIPKEFMFENFTPSLYLKGMPFKNFNNEDEHETTRQDQYTIAKIIKWHRYSLAMRFPEQRPGIGEIPSFANLEKQATEIAFLP